jgi:hypothetical protein
VANLLFYFRHACLPPRTFPSSSVSLARKRTKSKSKPKVRFRGHGLCQKSCCGKMEFLSLTGPIWALCVEVDREACELRYADPFPESHHRMLPRRVGIARGFFWALPVCSENVGRYSRTG